MTYPRFFVRRLLGSDRHCSRWKSLRGIAVAQEGGDSPLAAAAQSQSQSSQGWLELEVVRSLFVGDALRFIHSSLPVGPFLPFPSIPGRMRVQRAVLARMRGDVDVWRSGSETKRLRFWGACSSTTSANKKAVHSIRQQ